MDVSSAAVGASTTGNVSESVSPSVAKRPDKPESPSYVILMTRFRRKSDGGTEDRLAEFSHPVDVSRVEEWSGLHNVWFHELVEAADGTFAMSPFVRLSVTELSSTRYYFVAGYAFEFMEEEDVSNEISSPYVLESVPPNPALSDPLAQLSTLLAVGADMAQNLLAMAGGSLRQALKFYFSEYQGVPSGALRVGYGRIVLTRDINDEGERDDPIPYLLRTVTTYDFEETRKETQREAENMYLGLFRGGTESDYWVDVKKKEDIEGIANDGGIIGPFGVIMSDPFDSFNDFPLHGLVLVAARFGHIARLQVLHSLPFIDPLFRDDSRRTPFHFAAWRDEAETLGCLISLGMRFKEFTLKYLQFRDSYGLTPLRVAVLRGAADCVELILDTLKANSIELKENSNLCPLVVEAAHVQSPRILRALLKVPNIRLAPEIAYPAALFSAAHLDYESLRLLLDARPEYINECSSMMSSHKKTCIMFVCQNGTPENFEPVANLCLEKGADLLRFDEVGRSVLWFCTWKNHPKNAAWCIDNGVPVDYLQRRDMTGGGECCLDHIFLYRNKEWDEFLKKVGYDQIPLREIPRIEPERTNSNVATDVEILDPEDDADGDDDDGDRSGNNVGEEDVQGMPPLIPVSEGMRVRDLRDDEDPLRHFRPHSPPPPSDNSDDDEYVDDTIRVRGRPLSQITSGMRIDDDSLYSSVLLDSVALVQSRLSLGVEPRVLNYQMKPLLRTPLHLSLMLGQDSCTRALLSGGADCSIMDVFSRTPFHYAIIYNSPEFLNLMRENSNRAEETRDFLKVSARNLNKAGDVVEHTKYFTSQSVFFETSEPMMEGWDRSNVSLFDCSERVIKTYRTGMLNPFSAEEIVQSARDVHSLRRFCPSVYVDEEKSIDLPLKLDVHPKNDRLVVLSEGSLSQTIKHYQMRVQTSVPRSVFGAMSSFVSSSGILSEEEVVYSRYHKADICNQLATVVAILHSCDIVHGLIKSYHVLQRESEREEDELEGESIVTLHAVLADFGLHASIRRSRPTDDLLAPEFRDRFEPSKEADIFAFGQVILDLFCGPLDGSGQFDPAIFATSEPYVHIPAFVEFASFVLTRMVADRPQDRAEAYETFLETRRIMLAVCESDGRAYLDEEKAFEELMRFDRHKKAAEREKLLYQFCFESPLHLKRAMTSMGDVRLPLDNERYVDGIDVSEIVMVMSALEALSTPLELNPLAEPEGPEADDSDTLFQMDTDQVVALADFVTAVFADDAVMMAGDDDESNQLTLSSTLAFVRTLTSFSTLFRWILMGGRSEDLLRPIEEALIPRLSELPVADVIAIVEIFQNLLFDEDGLHYCYKQQRYASALLPLLIQSLRHDDIHVVRAAVGLVSNFALTIHSFGIVPEEVGVALVQSMMDADESELDLMLVLANALFDLVKFHHPLKRSIADHDDADVEGLVRKLIRMFEGDKETDAIARLVVSFGAIWLSMEEFGEAKRTMGVERPF